MRRKFGIAPILLALRRYRIRESRAANSRQMASVPAVDAFVADDDFEIGMGLHEERLPRPREKALAVIDRYANRDKGSIAHVVSP